MRERYLDITEGEKRVIDEAEALVENKDSLAYKVINDYLISERASAAESMKNMDSSKMDPTRFVIEYNKFAAIISVYDRLEVYIEGKIEEGLAVKKSLPIQDNEKG